jgi:hypothetical protein
MDAGGMRFEVLEPLRKHRTTYDGTAVFLTDPTQMTDPATAFRQNPHKHVRIDLVHEAVGPAYGRAGSGESSGDHEREFARAHYEQHMRVSGTMTIDGETFELDATGLRDHSWGPRYWQAIHSYRWLTCTFGPDFGIMVSVISPQPGTETQSGVVVRGEQLEPIRRVELDSQFTPGTPFHTGMVARLGLENGEELVLEGTVKCFIPLRNRRAGMVTHIGEGMTEYRCAGRTAFGISEYLDQVQ